MPFLQLWYPILPLDKADQGGRARKWIKGKGKWGFPPLRPVAWEAALPIRINANTLNVPDLALIVLSTAFNHFLMLCCNDLPNAYILKQMEGASCLSPSTRHAPKPGEGTILKKKTEATHGSTPLLHRVERRSTAPALRDSRTKHNRKIVLQKTSMPGPRIAAAARV